MPFVALDLETTGLDKKSDSIIEVALVKFDEKTFEVLETYTTLINPGIAIPQLNASITNISDQMVQDAPIFQDIISDIQQFIQDAPLLGHNVFFDVGFLVEKGVAIEKNACIDTFFLANALLFDRPSISLDSLCAYFEIQLENAHRALDDTLATIKLLQSLLATFNKRTEEEKKLFVHILSLSDDGHILTLRKYLGYATEHISFETVKKIILQKIGTHEAPEICYSPTISIDTTIDFGDSAIPRKNQKELLENIDKAFLENGTYIIEAATGVGKTLAYLLPAILFSLKTGHQVCISTKTKILQDQIYFSELPKSLKILNKKVNVQKFKGQQNYVSINSLFSFTESFSHTYTSLSFLSKIYLWLFQTTEGELDTLNFYSDEQQYVRFVEADLEYVNSFKNPYREYEFLYKARNNLQTANIVITNHAAFFADLQSSQELSNIQYGIFDEAHSLEEIATQALKTRYNSKQIFSILQEISELLQHTKLFAGFTELRYHIHEGAQNLHDALHALFFESEKQFELKPLLFEKDTSSTRIQEFATLLAEKLTDLTAFLKPQSDCNKYSYILTRYISVLNVFFDQNFQKENICIVQYHEYYGWTLETTVKDIGNFCQKYIWNKLAVSILLSATLKIDDSFEYIQNSLGLPAKSKFLSFESDFDYQKQAQLVIVKDVGSIKNNFQSVVSVIKKIIEKNPGHTLVLFTSFQSLKTAFFDLNDSCKSIGIQILAQGISGSKFRILEKFQEHPEKYIIFGTDSFWEGIDLPGESLKQLIIHKFPFSVPTEPIFLARSKKYQDAFLQFAVPKAIIKLKQGMGRLIRTRSDSGVIYLLDDRIYSTQWGKSFYAAFPKNITILQISSQDVGKK